MIEVLGALGAVGAHVELRPPSRPPSATCVQRTPPAVTQRGVKPSSIVVGAGAGGLVAALYLQRAGHDVLLLEAAQHVGGCASAFTARGFRFQSGATTLVGLEPEMPLGVVLAELGVDFRAPLAARNMTVLHRGQRLVLSTDTAANRAQLTSLHGADFARFWDDAVAIGARGWGLITRLHFPPRGPSDLLAGLTSREAWRLVPALMASTAAQLDAAGEVSSAARAMLDEVLLVSTQARAREVPWLFGALGLEYLQRPMYLPDGGLPSLLERLAHVFVERGGALRTQARVTGVTPAGAGYRVDVGAEAFEAPRVVLNLTHWDAERLVAPALAADFTQAAHRHPDAWATCTLHLGVRDVFGPDATPYHQVVLDEPLPVSGAHSAFVTLSRPDDTAMAPAGFRAVTVSCHARADGWDALSTEAHDARKQAVAEELLGVVARAFPDVAGAEKPVMLPGTPRTWERFTGRRGGRVGGLAFDFGTLLRGYPTGRTRSPGLVRVGDTVFPGQSVPACAWGARRVVGELLALGAEPRAA